MDNKMEPAMRHSVVIENRKSLQLTGVTDVESFDEQTVVLMTHTGELVIRGQGLHISKIDVASGNLSLEGEIDDLAYGDGRPSGGGLFSKLFR